MLYSFAVFSTIIRAFCHGNCFRLKNTLEYGPSLFPKKKQTNLKKLLVFKQEKTFLWLIIIKHCGFINTMALWIWSLQKLFRGWIFDNLLFLGLRRPSSSTVKFLYQPSPTRADSKHCSSWTQVAAAYAKYVTVWHERGELRKQIGPHPEFGKLGGIAVAPGGEIVVYDCENGKIYFTNSGRQIRNVSSVSSHHGKSPAQGKIAINKLGQVSTPRVCRVSFWELVPPSTVKKKTISYWWEEAVLDAFKSIYILTKWSLF